MKGINQNVGGWTLLEDDILFAWYPTHGARKVMELTGRTRQAVLNRARLYELKCEVGRVRNERGQFGRAA